jgi:hypothetical protein
VLRRLPERLLAQAVFLALRRVLAGL